MKTAIVNLATIVTGDWRDPSAGRCDPDGRRKDPFHRRGALTDLGVRRGHRRRRRHRDPRPDRFARAHHLRRLDAAAEAVGFLESYTHGGTTTAISASEVHVPGRPKDRPA